MGDRPTLFCKDCKFFRKGFLEPKSMAKCGHRSAILLDSNYLADGNASRRQYASSMRYSSSACGIDAKLWEPRR